MGLVMQFVVSVLGKDLFVDGFGGLTQNISEAQIFETFAQAEVAAFEAANDRTLGKAYGLAWEIRSIGVSN